LGELGMRVMRQVAAAAGGGDVSGAWTEYRHKQMESVYAGDAAWLSDLLAAHRRAMDLVCRFVDQDCGGDYWGAAAVLAAEWRGEKTDAD